jgi:hypothetical protein
MAESATLEAPPETKVEEDPIYEPEQEPEPVPLSGQAEEDAERNLAAGKVTEAAPAPQATPPSADAETKEAKPAEPVAETKPETPAAPEVYQHDEYMVERAIAHGATTAQIQATSSKHLGMWLKMKDEEKAAPAPTALAPKPEDDHEQVLAQFEKEGAIDPKLIPIFKAGLEARKEVKEIKEQRLRDAQARQNAELAARDERLMGYISSISPELAKTFDPARDPTSEAYKRYGEFLGMMGAIASHPSSATLPEDVRTRRALVALGIDVANKQAEKDAALEAQKEKFDKGALGVTTSRKGEMTLVDEIRAVKKKHGKPVTSKPDSDDGNIEPLPG